MNFSNGLSLRAQLYILVSSLCIFTLSASLYNNVSNMQDYLNDQLASHAQGAAYNLGLSISPYMDEEGLVTAEIMTNAIFDSGYYQFIRFTDFDDNILFERTNPTLAHRVPQWFMNWFTLQPPIMQSEVSDGWRLAGILKVQSNAGTSYTALYDHSISALKSTLLQLFIALIFSYFILKSVLIPLLSIEKQAKEVTQKQFNFNPSKPFTTELRTVVNAMNTMVANIQRSFSEQTALAEQLSQEVYVDSLTHLPNRRALLKRFDSLQAEAQIQGDRFFVSLVSMPSLQSINSNEGYGSGDSYISEGSELLLSLSHNIEGIDVYRISGSEFAILAYVTEEIANEFSQNMLDAFNIANSSRFEEGFANQVITKVSLTDSFTDVTKRLDTLLTHDNYLASPMTSNIATPNEARSRSEWVNIISEFTDYYQNEIANASSADFSIKCIPLEKLFDLTMQPVVDKDNNILYVESFVRFKHNGKELPTVDVFAMAERLGLLDNLERAVVSFIFLKLQQIKQTTVAINISNTALHDANFHQWLFTLYRQLQHRLPPILFEFNETAAMVSLNSTKQFISQAKSAGIGITIERFGSSLTSFQYIKNMDIDFVKLDGSYIRDIEQADTQFFIQTVTQICHGIGIDVIAPQIETEQVSQHCLHMNIDGLQGNGLFAVKNFNHIDGLTINTATMLDLADFN